MSNKKRRRLERRQMMQWWADYLDAKENSSNVLPFPVAW